MSAADEVRAIPLLSVFNLLGLQPQLKTRKGGTEWFGPCPACKPKHNQGNFSFDSTGRFNCFTCGIKGRGAIDLVKALKGCGFQQAVELLQSLGPVPEPVLAAAAAAPNVERAVSENPVFKGSYDKFYVPSDWLRRRGFFPSTLEHFGVGQYDNPKRRSVYKGKILFPISRYADGQLVGYLARTPDPAEGEPKYIWPKGFHKALEVYGAWRLKEKAPIRVLYLVESPLCVLRFYQLGLPAVSTFGWSISPEQADIVASLAKGLCYLPDRNVRDQAVAEVQKLAVRLWVRAPQLPNGIDDPEHLSLEQIRSLA